jgi:hypothetical protein
MKIKAYWGALGACLLGASLFWNKQQYPERSWLWIVGKSGVDLALLVVLTAVLPALVLAYSCIWTMDQLGPHLPKDRILRVTVAIITTTGIAWLGGIFLEALLFIGVFAMDLVTGRIWTLYRQKLHA